MSRGDEELLQKAGRGDMDALSELYVRHHRSVYSLCYQLVGDADAAEDLTHESFLRVRRYGAGFRGGSSVTTWLYRLVRNRCLDWLARKRRDRDRHAEMAELVRTEQREVPVDSGRQELVGRALERLTPEMREVLVLSRFGDLRYREIAEVCGISVANVKVRAHRDMKELRRVFLELEAGNEV